MEEHQNEINKTQWSCWKMVLTIPSIMTVVLILIIVSTSMKNEQKEIFTGIASTDIELL